MLKVNKLTMNIFHTFSSASVVDFEQVNVSWENEGYNLFCDIFPQFL